MLAPADRTQELRAGSESAAWIASLGTVEVADSRICLRHSLLQELNELCQITGALPYGKHLAHGKSSLIIGCNEVIKSIIKLSPQPCRGKF